MSSVTVPAATSDVCKLCGSTENLQRCARCKSVKYCSREHQIEHWRNGGHKKECEAINPFEVKKKKRSKNHKEKMQQNAPADDLYVNPIVALPYATEKSPEEIAKEEMERLLFENLNTNRAAAAVQQNLYNMTFPIAIPHLDECEFPLYKDTNLRMSLERGPGYIDELTIKLYTDMREFGMCVIDNFLGEDFGKEVLSEVHQMYKTDGIFKNGELVVQSSMMDKIRGDKIAWVKGTEGYCPKIREMIGHVDQLIDNVNGKLGDYHFQIRTKAMVAIYPGGGSHYVKHVDNPNRDGRCITAIYYLNENWKADICGGLLRIFPTRHGSNLDNKVANIEPIFDRLFLFWSDRRNPHEVQPAYQTRYAITLWYYDSAERAEARRNYLRGALSAPQS